MVLNRKGRYEDSVLRYERLALGFYILAIIGVVVGGFLYVSSFNFPTKAAAQSTASRTCPQGEHYCERASR